MEKDPFIKVAGKLTAALKIAGINLLPDSKRVTVPNKNSPTRLKAIPATAPKIAY